MQDQQQFGPSPVIRSRRYWRPSGKQYKRDSFRRKTCTDPVTKYLQKKAAAVAGCVGTVEDGAGAEITAYCLEPNIQGDKDPLL